MHLLYSNPHPSPEFCSVSLVLKPDPEDPNACSMGEPLLLASPVSTISYDNATAALKELHKYLTSLSTALTPNEGKSKSAYDQFAAELIQDDDKLLDKMQVFRPLAAHGIALHYRLIRDDKIVPDFASLVLASSRTGVVQGEPENNRKIESDLLGVLICVGLSGLPLAHCSSSLQYSLSQRVSDCVGILSKRLGTNDVAAAKTLLTTLLISEDEMRKTNEVADAAHITAIPESGVDAGGNLHKSRSQMASVLKSTKRLSVTMASGLKSGLFNRTGGLPEEANIHVGQSASSNDLARFMIERLNVLSVAESESCLRSYETSGQQRKANLDLTGTKSRFRKRQKDPTANADLDNFDYRGPEREQKPNRSRQGPAHSPGGAVAAANHNNTPPPMPTPPADRNTPKNQSKHHKAEGRRNKAFPTLSAPRGDMTTGPRRSSIATMRSDDHSEAIDDRSRRSAGKAGRRATADVANSSWNGDGTYATEEMSESSRGSASAGGARIQVNVALNEDLTCSYKFSKMTACSVEGVIQAQVKTNARALFPFQLLLRDPSEHMQNVQENKKFAEDTSASLTPNDDIDRRYTIKVPKADNYFPLIRYKCSSELKPVPIRVQTRVKADGGHCRVALQISSNPHNEGSLTDLTIIMGVGNEVRGESLVTQPAGGVWNASKRSVIWCVSELGDGEKFQLQARFEMESEADRDDKEPPKFPVLVRCQCMHAQLSDVEVEIREMDIYPADISMKVARRFRLSHQERS